MINFFQIEDGIVTFVVQKTARHKAWPTSGSIVFLILHELSNVTIPYGGGDGGGGGGGGA